MNLGEALAGLEERLTGLLAEVQDLRAHLWDLEEENAELREKLYQVVAPPPAREGRDRLLDLYEEGFHVCPPFFAKSRGAGQGCTVCLAFLAQVAAGREGEP